MRFYNSNKNLVYKDNNECITHICKLCFHNTILKALVLWLEYMIFSRVMYSMERLTISETKCCQLLHK